MPHRPSLREVAALYLKAGNLTFGGGDPTVASLQRELVDRRGWITAEQYSIAFSVARIVPGTNVLAFCAASAYQMQGWVGAVLSVLAASAPSAVLAVWILTALDAAQRNPLANAAAGAVLASVVGMMFASAWQLMKPALADAKWFRVVVFSGGALILREWLRLSPVEVLFAAGLCGAFWREGTAR
ncbi:MAG: chromate transporter [Candidatus Solibacter usitatus]|nr:chromate transporter [Candidatus Solibacter usitatus]